MKGAGGTQRRNAKERFAGLWAPPLGAIESPDALGGRHGPGGAAQPLNRLAARLAGAPLGRTPSPQRAVRSCRAAPSLERRPRPYPRTLGAPLCPPRPPWLPAPWLPPDANHCDLATGVNNPPRSQAPSGPRWRAAAAPTPTQLCPMVAPPLTQRVRNSVVAARQPLIVRAGRGTTPDRGSGPLLARPARR